MTKSPLFGGENIKVEGEPHMATRTVTLADVRSVTHEHRDENGQIVKTELTELTFHGVDQHGRISTRVSLLLQADDGLADMQIGDPIDLFLVLNVPTSSAVGKDSEMPPVDPAPLPVAPDPAAPSPGVLGRINEAAGLTPTPPPAEQPSAPLPSAQPVDAAATEAQAAPGDPNDLKT